MRPWIHGPLLGTVVLAIGCHAASPGGSADASVDASDLPLCSTSPLVCGNGRIDSCLVYIAASPGYYEKSTEQCDGAAFVTVSCQDLGYAGGGVGCSSTCTLDPSTCDICWPDPHVIDCASAPVDPPVVSALAVAPSDAGAPGSVLIAYATGADRMIGVVALSVQGASVTTLGTATVAAPADVIAIAPVPGGWLVAAGSSDLELMRFDASGAFVSRRTVATIGGASTNRVVAMAEGAGGATIVVWGRTDSSTAGALTATIVSSAGDELVAPFALRGDAPLGAAAIWSGNAFLVATSASTPTGYEVAMERVTSAGVITAGGRFATFAPNVWLGFPTGSLEGRLVYNHEHVYTEGGQRRIDLGGNFLGMPGAIDTDTIQAAFDDAHAIQLTRRTNLDSWIGIVPFDLPPLPQGILVANVDPAAVDPASALVGDVAIVAWVEFGHLRIGRVALP